MAGPLRPIPPPLLMARPLREEHFNCCFPKSQLFLKPIILFFVCVRYRYMRIFFCFFVMYGTGTGECTVCTVFCFYKCTVLYGIFVGCVRYDVRYFCKTSVATLYTTLFHSLTLNKYNFCIALSPWLAVYTSLTLD